ncbi:MAG: LamB/YcsF family protein [Chloroflexi bacterium]|jgi:UPF0271 protein|nr:LamB/YcsF family protein [Chloroflexota bacterium]
MPSIDLNADVGEGSFNSGTDSDAQLLPFVTSVNVACGFHAGSPGIIHQTVQRAAALGISIGAHPSYPDRAGFGRRFLDASPDEIYCDVLYQIGTVAAFCRAAGVPLRHVKPHGALYNHAATNSIAALAIVGAVRSYDPKLMLYAPPGSTLFQVAVSEGLCAIAEVFADRAINANGTLVSRGIPGAVLADPAAVARRAVRMVLEQRATAIDGTEVTMTGDTICLHGDALDATTRVQAVHVALEAAGITLAAPSST